MALVQPYLRENHILVMLHNGQHLCIFGGVAAVELLFDVVSDSCVCANAMALHRSNQIALREPRRRLRHPLSRSQHSSMKTHI